MKTRPLHRCVILFTIAACIAPLVQAAEDVNPLLTESTLPYQFPPFDQIRNEHFQPAIEKGMAEQLRDIEKIASSSEAPTFENTIVAMERSGRLLVRAERTFGNLNSANTNPEMQRIDKELSPKLSAHRDAIRLNGPLFARVQKIYDEREKLGLDPESKFLVERYYKDFVRAGAKLSEADKGKLKAMNSELATLQTQFEQNVLKEKNASSVVVEKREELDGLSDNAIAAAAAAAKDEGKEGKFVLRLQNTTGQPPLDSLKNRRFARADHESVAQPQQQRRRVRQSRGRGAHRAAPRRAGKAAWLRQSCRLPARGPDRRQRRDSEQDARRDRPRGGGQCAQGNRRYAGGNRRQKGRLQTRGLGLGFLFRAGAEGALCVR